jgi:hypothetical protein
LAEQRIVAVTGTHAAEELQRHKDRELSLAFPTASGCGTPLVEPQSATKLGGIANGALQGVLPGNGRFGGADKIPQRR